MLALDKYVPWEVVNAFKQVPPIIYQIFCRVPPLNAHIAVMHKQLDPISNAPVCGTQLCGRKPLRSTNSSLIQLACYCPNSLLARHTGKPYLQRRCGGFFQALVDQPEVSFCNRSSMPPDY